MLDTASIFPPSPKLPRLWLSDLLPLPVSHTALETGTRSGNHGYGKGFFLYFLPSIPWITDQQPVDSTTHGRHGQTLLSWIKITANKWSGLYLESHKISAWPWLGVRRRPIQGDTQFFSAEINLIPTKGGQVSKFLTGKVFTGQGLWMHKRDETVARFFIMQKCNSFLFHFMSQCSQWKEHTHGGFGTAHLCISYQPHPTINPMHLVNLFKEHLCQLCSPGAGGGKGRDVSEEGWMYSPCSPCCTNHPCKENKWAQKAVGKLLRERSPPGMSQAPKQFKELFWPAMGTNCPAEPLTAFLPANSLLRTPVGWQTQGCHRWPCKTQGFQQDIACHGPSVSQTQQSVWESPWECLRDPWAAKLWHRNPLGFSGKAATLPRCSRLN